MYSTLHTLLLCLFPHFLFPVSSLTDLSQCNRVIDKLSCLYLKEAEKRVSFSLADQAALQLPQIDPCFFVGIYFLCF